MNFSAYIERQKKLIRQRSGGETGQVFERRGEENKISSSDRFFAEFNSLKGLNTRERMMCAVQA